MRRARRRTSREIAARRGWPVEVHPLPALLHNRPARIAPAVERAGAASCRRAAGGWRSATPTAAATARWTSCASGSACAGCRGLHCYDVLAGARAGCAALLAREPGTYLLTDFLVRSFRRSVLAELGLDRHPELWPDYFGHYRRLVWLAQDRDAELDAEAAPWPRCSACR